MIWKPAFRMAWELSKPWHKPIFGTWADELGDENASINISHVYEDLSDEELNYAEEDLYYWLEDRGFQFNHGVSSLASLLVISVEVLQFSASESFRAFLLDNDRQVIKLVFSFFTANFKEREW